VPKGVTSTSDGHKQEEGKARVKRNKNIGKERPGQRTHEGKKDMDTPLKQLTKIRNVEGIIHRGKKSKSIKT
jgi:hypothetical protein